MGGVSEIRRMLKESLVCVNKVLYQRFPFIIDLSKKTFKMAY